MQVQSREGDVPEGHNLASVTGCIPENRRRAWVNFLYPRFSVSLWKVYHFPSRQAKRTRMSRSVSHAHYVGVISSLIPQGIPESSYRSTISGLHGPCMGNIGGNWSSRQQRPSYCPRKTHGEIRSLSRPYESLIVVVKSLLPMDVRLAKVGLACLHFKSATK